MRVWNFGGRIGVGDSPYHCATLQGVQGLNSVEKGVQILADMGY